MLVKSELRKQTESLVRGCVCVRIFDISMSAESYWQLCIVQEHRIYQACGRHSVFSRHSCIDTQTHKHKRTYSHKQIRTMHARHAQTRKPQISTLAAQRHGSTGVQASNCAIAQMDEHIRKRIPCHTHTHAHTHTHKNKKQSTPSATLACKSACTCTITCARTHTHEMNCNWQLSVAQNGGTPFG